MSSYYILYNPKANNGKGENEIKDVRNQYKDAKCLDITTIKDYKAFISSLDKNDCIMICGGDGTLNRFANEIKDIEINNPIYYYGMGTGNDFLRDLNKERGSKPDFRINEYIKNLPTVTVNGKESLFINGVGFGIDGYCCQVGDEQKQKSDKPVNYTSIAIKGLLFHFKPVTATVTVDGKKQIFKKVWIAPTMNGKYYGGGMMCAPCQDRNNNGTLSLVLMYGTGRIRTLMVFPSIFKGEHVKHTKQVAVLTGKNITVEFDRPTALQIDGETVLNVTSYSASIPQKAGNVRRSKDSQYSF